MRSVGLGRDNLRSHFVFRPRHAPAWLRARFLPVVFLANEEELTRKIFTTPLNITNPNTYVKFIFLRTSPLRQDSLEAILVIFGRSSLIFFLFESSWKKWKMTPLLCACAVVNTLETQNVENGHLTPSNLTFLLIVIDRNGFRRTKEEGQIYTKVPQIF